MSKTEEHTIWWSKSGDLFVQDGTVFQPSTGEVKLSGKGESLSTTNIDRSGAELIAAPSALGCTFIGGSGRNIFSGGLPPRSSGASVPTGWWRPTTANTWTTGIFSLVVTGPSAAYITDGDAILANLTTGGTAPVGNYNSTAYGQATYGELVMLVPQPFVLAVTGEEGGILGAIPRCRGNISAGTANGASQLYVPIDVVNYEGFADPDWTITISPDGSAQLFYLTDLIAERAAGGLPYDPAGDYVSTPLGMASYNTTEEEPIDGEEWSLTVEVIMRASRAGTVYLQLVSVGGVLTAVNGPFLATLLPPNTATEYHHPLGFSDGYSVQQWQKGPVVWEGPPRLPIYVVADLPAAAAGTLALVTDSTATLAAGHGNVVVGGGGNTVKVFHDGTDWRIG